jgi:hypothetical protein
MSDSEESLQKIDGKKKLEECEKGGTNMSRV